MQYATARLTYVVKPNNRDRPPKIVGPIKTPLLAGAAAILAETVVVTVTDPNVPPSVDVSGYLADAPHIDLTMHLDPPEVTDSPYNLGAAPAWLLEPYVDAHATLNLPIPAWLADRHPGAARLSALHAEQVTA